MPPSTVYSPVISTTRTDPIQKLLKLNPAMSRCSSGSSTPKTTPPAKIPTANLVTTCATSVMSERTVRLVGEKRRSRNSGIVNTIVRA